MPNLIPGFPQDVKQPRVLLLPQDGTQSIVGPYSPPHTHTHTHTHTLTLCQCSPTVLYHSFITPGWREML